MALTQKRLQELLSYDLKTGVFAWRTNGIVAGCLDRTTGYWKVGIDGKRYSAHRLAWLFVNGVLPNERIDHRNRTRSDNRLDNLRLATQSQNMANSPCRNSTTGVKGVYPCGRRFTAKIMKDYKSTHLGVFETAQEAHAAYCAAADKMFGEFARAA